MPINDNPYVPIILQTIDDIGNFAKENRIRNEQLRREESARDYEVGQKKWGSKLGILEAIMGSSQATPEARNAAANKFIDVVADPEADVGDLAPFQRQQGEPGEPGEPRYGISDVAGRFFPELAGEKFPIDDVSRIESDATQRYNAMKERQDSKGGLSFNFGGKKVKASPYLEMIDKYRDNAWRMLTTGYMDKYGDKMGINRENVSRFIDILDQLERAIRFDNWTEKEQEVFESLEPFEVSSGKLQGMIDELRQTLGETQKKLSEIK